MTACTVPDCPTPPTGRYLVGWRCPEHTPAAQQGRQEPPPGPGWPDTLAPRPGRAYGAEKADPLGREGPGWKYRTRNWGIPTRVKDATP